MAKFECNNCGEKFEVFCNDASDAIDVECQECGSHWTNMIFKEDDSSLLPVIPSYQKPNLPNFGPFPSDDPCPPSPPRIWYCTKKNTGNLASKIIDLRNYSY